MRKRPAAKVAIPYHMRDKTKPWFIRGMHGIGDNINQRPFIKSLVKHGIDVYLETPLPEFYSGIPGVKFVRSETSLRTQKKNEARSLVAFTQPPELCEEFSIGHDNETKNYYGVIETFAQEFQCMPQRADLPTFEPSPLIPAGVSIAVIRPTTVRSEWMNSARGPLNKYINEISCELAKRGYYCISVADTESGKEWIDGEKPFSHMTLHNGELSLTELMALVQSADIVVSGDCLLFHAAVAYGTPMCCVLGGWGHASHPMRISDPRCQDLSKTRFIWPDSFCMCSDMLHNCDKTISNLSEQVNPFLDTLPRPQFRNREPVPLAAS